jgi:hypothetical protein
VIQIRTDYTLQQHKNINLLIQQVGFKRQIYIVDIDTDFRKDKEITSEEIQIIREMMEKAKLITITTSPYFMDQKKAIEIIKAILQ